MSDGQQNESGSKKITSLTEQLLHAFEELDLLHSVCEILSSSSDPDEANTHILCEAMGTLAADVGWIVYDDGPDAGRPMFRQNIDARTATFLNESVVHKAIKSGEAVWTDNLAKDLSARGHSVPKAFLSVPLKTRNEILGAICLGKHADGAVFTAGDLKLVQILCAPAANAILQRRIERTSELKRYVSPQIAENVVRGGNAGMSNKRAELTMFMAELKGFTEAAEEIEPEELVEILNQYLSAMIDTVFAHEGTLDKFVVGSIFGFFGDPIVQEDHAVRAIRLAEAMQKTFAELQTRWRAEGYTSFGLGIGINTGYVTVGHVGSSNRTDYTTIGRNAVVAGKLAGIAEPGQILVSQRTVTKVRNAVKTRFLMTCDVGTQSVKVFQVEYEKPQQEPEKEYESSQRAARNDRSLGSGVAISHYRIIEKLGAGGMGEVYKAEDLKLTRTVALKVLPPSSQGQEVKRRFVREAKSLSALNHPNIATIYEIDEHNGVDFIAMEYIAGRTLTAILDAETLSVARVLDLIIPVAEALRTAHDKNIIHRDIKPTNIMASDLGYVKVLDFGLATLAAPPETDDGNTPTNMMTHVGEMCGTVGYMSPEQAMGLKLDQRSDIFSFGVVLYELITGRQPFVGANPMAVLHAVTFDQPPPVSRLRPDAAGELESIVNKALQKKANDRYQSLKEALADLRRLRNDISRTVPPDSTFEGRAY